MGVFLFAILLWTIREPMSKQFSWFTLSDTGVAMLAALLIFALPTDLKNMKFVLDWSDTKTLPWGILILFGGGLALADGMSDAGLIDEIGNFVHTQQLATLGHQRFSDTGGIVHDRTHEQCGTCNHFSSCSCRYCERLRHSVPAPAHSHHHGSKLCLHAADGPPPNAIVFASGHVKVRQMVRIGVVLNLISVLLLAVLAATLIPYLFG